jgi:hypothetical protein
MRECIVPDLRNPNYGFRIQEAQLFTNISQNRKQIIYFFNFKMNSGHFFLNFLLDFDI